MKRVTQHGTASPFKVPRKLPDNIVTLFHLHGRPFRFNKMFVLDSHSTTHFAGSALLCMAWAWLASLASCPRPELWGLGIALFWGVLWEFGDGFKPLWYEDPYHDWRDNFLRADGFSWSDIAFDMWGVLIGIILLQLFFGL